MALPSDLYAPQLDLSEMAHPREFNVNLFLQLKAN